MSTDATPKVPRQGKRRGLRTLVWCVVVLGVLGGALTGSAFWAQGKEITAPEWLRDCVEARLSEMIPEAQITFGDLGAVLGDDWRPRFAVRNVSVVSPEGKPIVSFSDVRGELNASAILERRLTLESLEVSGVFVTLRRDENGITLLSGVGAENVSGGSSANAGQERITRHSSGVLEMISDVDDFLLRPGMAELADVDIFDITLRYEDGISNRAWTVDGGRLRLDRTGKDLQIALDLAILSGGAGVATLSANYAGIIGVRASDFGITFADVPARDIASQGAAFSWLQALDAPISGALRGGLADDGQLQPLNATLQIGAGVIQPSAEASPIPIAGARSYFSYDPRQLLLNFSEFTVDSKWGSGRLEGQAHLNTSEAGALENFVGQFRLDRLMVNPQDMYPEAINVEAAEMDFRLNLQPFSFELGRLQVRDQDRVLNANGQLSVASDGWHIALDAEMDALAPERLLELWPEGVKPKSRKWIDENVFAGKLHDIAVALRLKQAKPPVAYLKFDFDEAELRFMKSMPYIKNGKGHVTLMHDRFVAVLDDGGVTAPQGGYVNASGTAFIIPDVRVKPDPPGVIRLNAAAPVTAALALLDRPPLAVMSKANLPVDVAQGAIDVTGTISLPLKKKTPIEEVSFDIAGIATNIVSEKLIKNRTLAVPSMRLTASDEEIRLEGQGTLDGVPLDVVWRQPIVPKGEISVGRVSGTVELSAEALDTFSVSLPPGTVQGRGSANIDISLVKGSPPDLSLRSDLVGIELAVPQISWFKRSGTQGALEVDVILGDVPDVQRLSIEAPGLTARGGVELSPDRQLERVRFDRLVVGNWLDAPVDLVGRGPGQPPGVVLRGGVIDLRQADLASGSNGGANTPLTVALDRLQVSDTIAITNMRGQFTTSGGLGGTFEGAVNGATTVSGQLVPQGGRSAIRLTAANAGQVFAAAGLLQQAREGRMELTLQPVGTGGAFDGNLRVSDVRIKDAPAIAALLNAISIVGLVNELTGEGIYFSEITADFRMSPSQITLREASAVGSSMGLSMDGVFVPGTGQLQMQGVISPVYLINAIGSVLTRPGEGLFGFNYSITGTTKKPEVFVNPLTALAPGMFRNLFRRAQPEVPREAGEVAPEPAPRRAPVVTRGEDR